jgi:hypothetical protein
MDGGIGRCANEPCGQLDALTEDGFCSDTCRMEATGCSDPGCSCGGECDGVSACSSCGIYTWGVVAGRCPDCREVPVGAQP